MLTLTDAIRNSLNVQNKKINKIAEHNGQNIGGQ